MAFPRLADPVPLHTADLSLCVPGSAHSLACIVRALHAELGPDPEAGIRRVEADPIDGQGLMSNIHRLTLHRAQGQPFVAILKVPTTAKMERLNPIEDAKRKRTDSQEKAVEIGWDMDKFRRLLFEMSTLEANFYTMVAPQLPRDLRPILPRVFDVHAAPSQDEVERGFLLMKDMSGRGVPADFYNGLTAGQVESTLVHLARLHAFSRTLPSAMLAHFRLGEYGRLDGMADQLAERVLALDERPEAYFQRHRAALHAFMHAHSTLRTDVHTRMGIRPVLSHGDFWANNLLFCNKQKNDGVQQPGDELCAILDWQTCHENTGLNDVLRLLLTSVNAPLCKERMEQWLDLYFDTLEAEDRKLTSESDQPSMAFSQEMRRTLYGEQRHHELVFACMCLPTLFPEAPSDAHRANLLERMQCAFEEARAEYEQCGKTNGQ